MALALALAFLASGAPSVVAAEPVELASAGVEAGPPQAGHNFTVTLPSVAMIWISPGTFRMSSTHGTGDDTIVTFTRGYWLGRTEVTQAQWQALIERATVFRFLAVPSFHKGSERPVERVSWEMVMAFCADLNAREHSAGRLPLGYEYSLPTEAQWEYACRAGTTGKYAGEIAAMAWYADNSGRQTHPVALKQPNAWGLYDMHGNVIEWCADWYGAYPGGRVKDPAGPVSGVYRVVRGGAATGPAGAGRSAMRDLMLGGVSAPLLGFRLALVPRITRPAASATP